MITDPPNSSSASPVPGPGDAKAIPAVPEGTPPSGRRQALRDLRRQLTDEDLTSPGAQKLLLDELERLDTECDTLRGYVTRFHEADKRAAVLEERQRTHTAMEVAFGVGVGLGGTILGFTPALWDKQPLGTISVAIGALLVLGATIARIIKR